MTDNNWITPEWAQSKVNEFLSIEEYKKCKNCIGDNYEHLCRWCENHSSLELKVYCDDFVTFLSAEINKEIQNILDSAEKRDCKTCKRAQYTVYCQECLACYFETKKTYPNWTPKEVK